MVSKARGVAIMFILLVAVGAGLLKPRAISADNLKSGAVYVLTNQPSNAIAAFRVESDGSLTPIAVTGGLPFASQGIAAR
jgi:hypothetical protein